MHGDDLRLAAAPERLERLLHRHTDVRYAAPDGRECLYRTAQLVATAGAAAHAEEHLRRWTDGREDLLGPGVARFRLRAAAGDDLLALAGDSGASPVHLLRGEPAYSGGPADVPRVPAALPPPPGAAGPVRRPVTVAVLDTGLDAHPWFTGEDWWEPGADTAERLDADLDYRLDAQAGHGTFVAGVVRSVAPAARLEAVRVLSSDGLCDEVELAEALARLAERAAAGGRPVDVLNLSLGGYRYDDRPSPVLARALTRFGPHTAVVAAAGNAGSERPFWPAALKTVIGVGALDAAGARRAAFSNSGPWVDACAPGEGVVSAFVSFDGPGGDGQGGVPDGIDPDDFAGFAQWSGTSFAAPAVAGAVAALAGATGGTAAEAAWQLLHGPDAEAVPGLGTRVPAAVPVAAP